MKKRHFVGLLLSLAAACGLVVLFVGKQGIQYSVSETSDGYREYAFDSGEDVDMGFTRRVLERIRVSEDMLTEGATAIENGAAMKDVRLTDEDRKRGVIERREAGTDAYELRSGDVKSNRSIYSVFKNDELLFVAAMEYGSDGPVLDWRVVDGMPALTYRTGCDQNCDSEIFFGGPVSKTWNVTNPRYLFSYDGKVGFVAEDGGVDAIFFDGKFVTPGFDAIWTHNCCSSMEILPTVYENGTLLFHARRDGVMYLVETQLR